MVVVAAALTVLVVATRNHHKQQHYHRHRLLQQDTVQTPLARQVLYGRVGWSLTNITVLLAVISSSSCPSQQGTKLAPPHTHRQLRPVSPSWSV
ncbi:hypothetical protein E2C01_028095 [Portunus trituberculatus]|uniref:Uncharacterized protein n=1 Tax=Portunus trituberculatus TaxID=210409 RepID=A0A5B7EMQ4_PORTR|nr:hypothetical protein [Portunus trituberculatus]